VVKKKKKLSSGGRGGSMCKEGGEKAPVEDRDISLGIGPSHIKIRRGSTVWGGVRYPTFAVGLLGGGVINYKGGDWRVGTV